MAAAAAAVDETHDGLPVPPINVISENVRFVVAAKAKSTVALGTLVFPDVYAERMTCPACPVFAPSTSPINEMALPAVPEIATAVVSAYVPAPR